MKNEGRDRTTTTVRKPPYTVQSAAVYLSLPPRTIRNLIKRRMLRTSRITRKILIPAEDVENRVDSTC
jgi:excisionase family DNA binding protein